MGLEPIGAVRVARIGQLRFDQHPVELESSHTYLSPNEFGVKGRRESTAGTLVGVG
jgi:hypothetical protein